MRRMQKRPWYKTPLGIGGIAALVIALGLVVFFLLRGSGNKEPVQPQKPSQEQTNPGQQNQPPQQEQPEEKPDPEPKPEPELKLEPEAEAVPEVSETPIAEVSDNAVIEEPVKAESYTEEMLEKMSVSKLRTIARELQVDNMTREQIRFGKKTELIQNILEFTGREM